MTTTITLALAVFAAESTPADIFKALDKNSDGKLTAAEVGKEKAAYFKRLLRIGDADKDGRLTLQEFKAAVDKKYTPSNSGPTDGRRPGGRQPIRFSRDAFNRLDRNSDGKLTMQELPQTLKARFKPLFDRTKKTELTYDEIVRIISRRPSQNFRRNIDALFTRLDVNKDGKLTVAEQTEARYKPYLTFLLRNAGKKPGDALTKQEFVTVVQKQAAADGARVRAALKQFDKNSDGVITKDEATGRLKQFFTRFDRNRNGKLEPGELAIALRFRGAKKKQQ